MEIDDMLSRSIPAVALTATSPRRWPAWIADLTGILAATFVIFSWQALGGFATLANLNGDSDSIMRLVQIRDLIAGQAWFDLQQVRLGSGNGVVMHWSRIVDAPIALLTVALTELTGDAGTGEHLSAILWPLGLFAFSLVFLVMAARRYGGAPSVFPAIILGSATLYHLGIFQPGVLDHHNLQLALTLGLIVLLLGSSRFSLRGVLCGLFAALMLAIGMETAPYVGAGCLAVALIYLAGSPGSRSLAIGFGISLATSSAFLLLATVPFSRWLMAECDAFSLVQFSVVFLGGTGLALMAASQLVSVNLSRRISALVVLAGLIGVIVVTFFPSCLSDPYASLDPRLRDGWLASVVEAQSLPNLLRHDPVLAASRYSTPLLAAGLVIASIWHHGWLQKRVVVAGFLLIAIAVSIWQVRGSVFSLPIAVVVLSTWIGSMREGTSEPDRHGSATPVRAALMLALAWIISFNAAWDMTARAVLRFTGATSPQVSHTGPCHDDGDFAQLAGHFEPQTVLAVSNLGPSILKTTQHRVLAGPYHRNEGGNLMVLEIFSASSAEARTLLRQNEIGLIAHCPGNSESEHLAQRAPESLMADLLRGERPPWLHRLPGTADSPLKLFRLDEPLRRPYTTR